MVNMAVPHMIVQHVWLGEMMGSFHIYHIPLESYNTSIMIYRKLFSVKYSVWEKHLIVPREIGLERNSFQCIFKPTGQEVMVSSYEFASHQWRFKIVTNYTLHKATY